MAKEKTFSIRVIDHIVDLPLGLDKKYTHYGTAYVAICNFVHSYDYILQVDGAIVDDETGEDIDFVSSFMC